MEDEFKGILKEEKTAEHTISPIPGDKFEIINIYIKKIRSFLENFKSNLKKKFPDLDMNYAVIVLVALSQGFQGLSDLALSYLYKDDFKLQPFQVTHIASFTFIPWIIKPLYGFISDSFPIFGYRRKPYLFIFGFTVSFCWLMMALFVESLYVTVFIILLNQFGTAFCNVIGEALVVETSQKQKEHDPESGAKNVSIFFFVKSFGSLVTAFSSGALLEIMDKRKVFFITSLFPLLIVISAYLLDEKKIENLLDNTESNIENGPYNSIQGENLIRPSKTDELKKQINLLWTFLKMEQIYKPIIFIFLYSITPSYGDPMFYFYTNVLHFQPMTMGRLKLVYGLSLVFGIWFYNKYLRRVGFKKIIIATTILSMCFNMMAILLVNRINIKIGIPDFLFCITTDSISMALSEINTMPLLVLACNICPKNIEGTLYAVLMSIMNFGYLLSNQFGGILSRELGLSSHDFHNLSWLIFIANIIVFLPMPTLYLVNESDYLKEDKKQEDRENDDEVTKNIVISSPQSSFEVVHNENKDQDNESLGIDHEKKE